MVYPLSERAPGASNLTAKNRVWGFFENSNRTRPANRRKPSELRRKIRPTPTKTASGIPYWPSRDPIEERGGVNLYGFVMNNGIDKWDVIGLVTLADSSKSLKDRGIAMLGSRTQGYGCMGGHCHPYVVSYYTDTQIFDEWMRLEKADNTWLQALPDCPKCLKFASGIFGGVENPNSAIWDDPTIFFPGHPGAEWCMRSKRPHGAWESGQQCCYDSLAMLMTSGAAAGTPDRKHASFVFPVLTPSADTHWAHDVDTHNLAKKLGRDSDYLDVRPPNKGI